MKVSVIISIYQSHEIVRRQIEYFKKMNLPDDVEFIFIDDNSNPPLEGQFNNFSIYRLESKLAWTQNLARNYGANKSQGEYLLMTDIDHILSRAAIEAVRNFTGEMMIFKRYLGILDENGDLTQDIEKLKEWGVNPARLVRNGVPLYASVHGNTFAIKKMLFEKLGGYNENLCLRGYHGLPGHRKDDSDFRDKWKQYSWDNNVREVMGPDIYMFPIGLYHKDNSNNPNGLFHSLSYEAGTPINKTN